jgi:hypothetical protein
MLDRAKSVSLRFLTHRAIGYARASDRFVILDPVITLLNRILSQDGRQSSVTNEGYVNPGVEKSGEGLMIDATQESICATEQRPVSSNSPR